MQVICIYPVEKAHRINITLRPLPLCTKCFGGILLDTGPVRLFWSFFLPWLSRPLAFATKTTKVKKESLQNNNKNTTKNTTKNPKNCCFFNPFNQNHKNTCFISWKIVIKVNFFRNKVFKIEYRLIYTLPWLSLKSFWCKQMHF